MYPQQPECANSNEDIPNAESYPVWDPSREYQDIGQQPQPGILNRQQYIFACTQPGTK
jgi:hypothetical protein